MADPSTTSDTKAEYRSYPDIVWQQFQKRTVSYIALWGVGILFLIALIAPLIALNVPFYLHVPQGVGPEPLQGTSFPWFRALFDINFFENRVDLFFNFLLFSLPVNVAAWYAVRGLRQFRSTKHRKQVRSRFVAISIVVQIAMIIGVFQVGFRQPYVDYVRLAERDGVSAVFPFFEFSYRDTNVMQAGLGPTWEHWLGTDRQGRDVLTRIVYGTRISLTIGIVAMGIATFIGTILGSLAGYFGGKVDMVILRLIEVFLVLPVFYLILTMAGFVEEPSIFYIMVIIGIVRWTGIARLVRGEFLRLREEDFVRAAEALGLPRHRVIFRHILPNALGPVLVSLTFGIAGAILLEAGISFLGVGDPTAPSWGQILKGGETTMRWSLIAAPGIALFITITLLNLVGEGLRDAMDPKLRK